MKSFTAYFNIIDNDYHCWCGNTEQEVDDYHEAVSYGKETSWSGISYNLDYMRCNKTGKILKDFKEYTNHINSKHPYNLNIVRLKVPLDSTHFCKLSYGTYLYKSTEKGLYECGEWGQWVLVNKSRGILEEIQWVWYEDL